MTFQNICAIGIAKKEEKGKTESNRNTLLKLQANGLPPQGITFEEDISFATTNRVQKLQDKGLYLALLQILHNHYMLIISAIATDDVISQLQDLCIKN